MPTDRETFEGGVAVITGAGAGIGEGLARRCAALGMKLALAEISQDRLDRVAESLRSQGTDVLAVRTDVSIPSDLDRLAAAVHEAFGDVRLLINNAGIETVGYSWEIPAERWERTLDINIHGVVHGVRAFAPRMIASGTPCYIANLSSVGGFSVMPTQTAYIMSKHAVQSFTECLALEMELTGKPVHVCSIIPGMVKTSIFNDAGYGEAMTPDADRLRLAMRDYMVHGGMELDTACQSILEQIAAGAFWVSTQPEMTDALVNGRIEFLSRRDKPFLTDETRMLLGRS